MFGFVIVNAIGVDAAPGYRRPVALPAIVNGTPVVMLETVQVYVRASEMLPAQSIATTENVCEAKLRPV